MVIKHKLITARKEKNMTQNDMAELLFMSQSQYQRRERGEIRISDEEWVRIAKSGRITPRFTAPPTNKPDPAPPSNPWKTTTAFPDFPVSLYLNNP